MDITALFNMSSGTIEEVLRAQEAAGARSSATEKEESFAGILDTAMENIRTTNSYLSDAENEMLRFAMGETENTHDLVIAQSKAATAVQYTVAIRDKFLESYKELMNMQI